MKQFLDQGIDADFELILCLVGLLERDPKHSYAIYLAGTQI